MNNYSIEETRKNMIELMDDFYWNYNNTALNKIVEGPLHKNKYIQELFKNTNGRIILDLELSEKEKTEKLMTYLMNNFSSYKQVQVIDSLMIELKENFEELEDTELTQYEVVHKGVKTILSRFYNSLESMFTNTPDLLNSKGQLLDGPFKGQKITKFINNWFDYVFTINQNIFMRSADDGMFKSVTNFIVKYIKNKVLGQINFSEVIGKSNNLLILSIKPEDFFTMSLGHNWRSCLHPEDGEYNTACVEYNTGKDSLLSFVIPKSEVNNIYVEKIWRQIMYITDNVGINTSDAINGEVAVFSQKGYPSTNEYADEISQKYIKEHLPELQLRPLRAGHISLYPAWGSQGGYGYIDCFKGFTNSRINQVILSNAVKDRTDFISRVSATEGVPCFECGCEGVELSSTNGLCHTCAGNGYYCEWCDCYCDEDDEVSLYSSQGEISMCRECADNKAVFSDYYQDLILIEDSVNIMISPYYTKDEIIKKMQHEGLLSHDIIKIDDFINLMTRNSAQEVVLMEDSVYSEMIDIDLLSSDATEVKICFEDGDSQWVYLPSEFAKVASELIFKE